ncbi:MAG: hypothetical protein K6G10_09335 [Butyrivibrio sp.]|nr:hypothetical protein [Butyrivibrio sp.]
MLAKLRSRLDILAGAAFAALSVYYVIRSFLLTFSTDIWYDELFSMEFVKRPVSELISLTARDVHPPLYYLILKAFEDFGKAAGFVGDGAELLPVESAAKMVSLLPFVIMIIYAMTTVRKHFGMLTAGLFSLAIVVMPQLPEYTTEIRMYSWAMLFVTATLLHSFGLYRHFIKGAPGWDIPDGAAIFVYTAAAAYTHYYAAFCVGIILGLLFIRMLCAYVSRMKGNGDKVSFKAVATLIICMNLSAVSYIPWASVVLSQVKAVKSNYWIQPVGIRSLGSCVKYIYMGYFFNDVLIYGLSVAMFLITAALVIRAFLRVLREKDMDAGFSVYAFLILLLEVAVGLAVSALIRPVFVNRYMLPAFGCLWLSVCIMLGKEIALLRKRGFKKQLVPGILTFAMILMMLVTGIQDYKVFRGNEEYRKVQLANMYEYFDTIDPDTIVISNFDQAQALLSYYLNRGEKEMDVYLYGASPEALMSEMLPTLKTIEDPVDIHNYLVSGKDVLFLGSFNSREDILLDWNEMYGITSKNEGSYLMERYWFDAFRLQE